MSTQSFPGLVTCTGLSHTMISVATLDSNPPVVDDLLPPFRVVEGGGLLGKSQKEPKLPYWGALKLGAPLLPSSATMYVHPLSPT